MNDINSIFITLKNIFDVEVKFSKELQNEKLQKFKQYLGINWELSPIFYNDTYIFFTSPDDYKKTKFSIDKAKDVLKIESDEFNLYLICISYINCYFLCELLRKQ